jgi:hypothetical protein
VLVEWQIATGRRNCIPRLGAPLIGISISGDGSFYGTIVEDNSIKIIRVGDVSVTRASYGLKRGIFIVKYLFIIFFFKQ